MSDVVATRAPGWLRMVAGMGLLWNLYGVYEYLRTVGVAPGGDAAASATLPTWVTGAFAIAVFAGALGCLGLVMLKRWSKLLLLVSLLAVLAMQLWIWVLTEAGSTMPGAEVGVNVAVALIALLMVWLAYSADRKGWLS